MNRRQYVDELPGRRDHNAQFATRLETAVRGHPGSLHGKGDQKWLRDLIAEKYNVKISPQAVNSWFTGRSYPRQGVMEMIATVLEVDYSWLALGTRPEKEPVEGQLKRNSMATGPVNAVAGFIQMEGGVIAFPDDDKTDAAHIHAIIGGKSYAIEVKPRKVSTSGADRYRIAPGYEKRLIIVTDHTKEFSLKIYRITSEIIKTKGRRKDGFFEIAVDEPLPELKSFRRLETL